MTTIRALGRLTESLRRFCRREDGNSGIELVIVMPAIMYIFMMSFESGMYMTKRIMLERAVDLTTRGLRLGQYENPTMPMMKTEICSRALMLTDCDASIHVELVPVSTSTWALPATTIACVDRDEDIQPAVNFRPGVANELMMVRVCIVQDAIFPGTGIADRLSQLNALDNDGGYAITAVSSFVNEP